MGKNIFDSSTGRNELTLHSIIFTLSVLTIFSGSHVGRPTFGTKSFDSALNSLLSDGPTGYMTNRSSCLTCYTMYKVIMRRMK